MPQYQIEIPGQGKFQFDSPVELTQDQAYAVVQAELAKTPEPKKGLGAAVAKGTESMVSQMRSGLGGIFGSPEEAATAGLERGKGISAEYADQIGLDKVKEAYGRGLLPAAGEVIRQVPLALAEQFPNLAAMAGSARAGAMAGARMGPYGAIAGGLAGALLPSGVQQFGGDIERQAATQQDAEQPVAIDRGAALAATAVQAPLDVLGTYIPLGGRLVGKLVGIPEKALLGDATGKVAKLAEEKLLATLAKGTATGVLAEVPTEVAQQMLERAQAGLPLADADALKEYGETIYQTALLGPLGAVGRVSEKAGARSQIEQQKQEERRKAQIAQAEQDEQLAQQKQAVDAAAAAQRETPEFAQEAAAKYTALQKQIADLLAITKTKVDPTDLAGIAAKKEAAQKLKDLRASEEFKQTIADYRQAQPILAKMQAEQAAAEAAAQKQAARQQAAAQVPPEPTQPFAQQMIPGTEGITPPEAETPAATDEIPDATYYAQRKQALQQLRNTNMEQQSAAAAKGDTAAWKETVRRVEVLDRAEAEVDKQLALLGKVPPDRASIEKKLEQAQKAFKKNSGAGYDRELAVTQVAKIDKLIAQLQEQEPSDGQMDFGFDEKTATKDQYVESKESFGSRVYKPGAADIEAQEQAYLDDVAEQEAQAARDLAREQKIAPERNALFRMAQPYKNVRVDTEGKPQISSLTDRLAEALRTPLKGIAPGRVTIGEGSSVAMSSVDELRAQISYARATNNKGLVTTLQQTLDDLLNNKEEVPGSAVEEGAIAREAGVEASLSTNAKKANVATRYAQQQIGAFERLERLIDSVRTQAETSDIKLDLVKQEMAKHRQVIVGAALNEIDARRAAAGLPSLSVNEQLALIPRIEKPINELINRGAKELEQLTSRKAQMRGSKIVLSAEEEQRPPKGQRVLGGGRTDLEKHAQVLGEQMRDVIEEGYGIPEEERKPLGPKRGMRPLLRPTPPGELELPQEEIFRRAEDSETASKEDKSLLSQAIDKFDRLGSYTQALVIEQAKRITNDMPIDATMELKTALAMLEVANASNLEQRDLFEADPDYKFERATAKNFQKALNSQEVQKLRKAVAEIKAQEAFMAKRQATLDAKVKSAQDFMAKMEAGKAKTPVEAAQRALDRLQESTKDVRVSAERERISRFMRQKGPLADLIDIVIKNKALHKKAEANFDTVLQNVSNIFLVFHSIQNDLAAGRAPKTNQKALTELSVFLPQARAILERASNRLDANARQLAKSSAAVDQLRASHEIENKADVVGRTVMEAGKRAEASIEKARQNLAEAETAEKSARRGLELRQAEAARPAKEPGPLEGIEARVTGTTTVFRNTADPEVQAEITKQRTALARSEGLYEKERAAYNDALYEDNPKEMERAQKAMYAAESAMNAASKAMSDAFNNAPLVKVNDDDRLTQAQYAEHEAALERLLQADMARLYQEAGISMPRLAVRRSGPVVTKSSAAPSSMRTGSEESRAGQTATPTRGAPAKEGVAEEIEISVLDQIARKRAALETVQKQLTFIAENPATTKVGKTKQADAKRRLRVQLKEGQAELAVLVKEQQETVRLNKESKGIRKETRSFARQRADVLEESEAQENVSPTLRASETKTEEATAAPDVEESVRMRGDTNVPEAETETPARRKRAEGAEAFTPAPFIENREAQTRSDLAEMQAAAAKRIASGEKYQRGVEVESPDLTAEQVTALENNKITAALKSIAADSRTSKLNKSVALRLAELLDNTNVKIAANVADRTGASVLGKVNVSGTLITLNRKGGLSQETLLHEATHAAVERVLSMPDDQLTDIQRVAKRELMALHAAIKNDPRITSTYAKGSLSEFTAEVMSNRALQLQLSDKKWKLSDAWKGFKSIVLRMLGIERPETMLGAAIQSVDALFMPTSVQQKGQRKGRRLSAKDIAALHTGSNSMKQFAAQFGVDIKQKDRSIDDAERIAEGFIRGMLQNPEESVAAADPEKLNYTPIMADGKAYNPDNPLHYLTATVDTFATLRAKDEPKLRRKEAEHINKERHKALQNLIIEMSVSDDFTGVETALIAKAAAKYAAVADKSGRLKIAEISANNRHPVAVVGPNAVNAIIQELRAGKDLKDAFIDGLQKDADISAELNKSKDGWQKFDQSKQYEDAVKLNAACAGTSWCTGAALHWAQSQLGDGDFYVNYKNGKPMVAVRMIGQNKIAEVRGNTPNQDLNADHQKIAEEFIRSKKFKESSRYLEELIRKDALISGFTNGVFSGKELLEIGGLDTYIDDDTVGVPYGWYNFSGIDGHYGLRPKPSEAVEKELKRILTVSVQKAIDNGHYVTGMIFVTQEGKAEFSWGKKRIPVALEDIKSVDHMYASAGSFPNLVRVNTLSLEFTARKVEMPKLQKVERLSIEQRGYSYPKYSKSGGFYFSGNTIVENVVIKPSQNKDSGNTVNVHGLRAITGEIKRVHPFNNAKTRLTTVNLVDTKYAPSKDFTSVADLQTAVQHIATDALAELEVDSDLFEDVGSWVDLPTSEANTALKFFHNVEKKFVASLSKTEAKIAKESFLSYDDAHEQDDPEPAIKDRFFSVIQQIKNTTKADTNYLYTKLAQAIDPKAQEMERDVVVNTPARIAEALPVEEAANTDEEFLYSKPMYANDTLAAAGAVGDQFIAQNQSTYSRIKANSAGLAFETSYIDRFAGFEKLAKLMPSLKGTQMMYYLRMYDQRMNFVSQSVSRGALQLVKKTRPDGGKEFLIESKEGPSLAGVVGILKDATKMVGNGQGVNRLFTLYLSALRAKSKGLDALHFGTALTQADLDRAMKAIADTPGLEAIFKSARDEYNAYNRGLINFAVQTDALSKDVAATLLKENDYIPWYRQRNGVAELVIGKETPIHVGSIANQPYLQELIGGDTPILDFMTSSVQNTNLLTDMALRNRATLTSVMELVEMKLAKIGSKNAAGPNIVRFRVEGEDRAAMIDTDTAGVPADILVKGMEGIPVQLSGIARMLAFPSTILRKAITLSPLYVARQLFRDSLAAPILSGADFMPITGALKELNSSTKATLESRGITGGQIFTGGSEDLTKILQDITDGKSTWMQGINKLQAMNMEADALTRRAQYNSYIKQGLSEMEATLMSLESMNFNKRGASPSIHLANSLIPFFNAQIQSMNVLYKALSGKLPFNERLKIQEKLLTRGLMVAGISLTYTAAMQDDEAYKNATPDQKYGNWFFRIPGIDEPLRLPIPFEIGYIFKALPEALYNTMMTEHGGEEAVKAFATIFKQLIPGGTSYGIPQAMKPAIEAKLGKSFYTGRDILNRQEQMLLPEQQVRAETTEASKYIASGLGMSPIILDGLVQGYTGTLGLAFLQAVSAGLPTMGQKGPEQAYKRLSEMPVIGGAFQPNDAGGIITNVYERMLEIQKLDKSVDALISKGLISDAKELLAKRGNEYMMSEAAGEYISTIRELTQYENAIKASDLSPEEKRKKLDELRQMKIRYSDQTRQAVDRTTLQ